MRFLQRLPHAMLFISYALKWKSAVDRGKLFGALLTDLSKGFVFLKNLCLQNFMLMDLALRH